MSSSEMLKSDPFLNELNKYATEVTHQFNW